MTLKNKKNHYDIKVLRGYGSGIYVKNQRLILKDGIDVFSGKAEVEEYIPQTIPYSRIVIIGKSSYLTSKAILLLSQNHINVIFLDSFGNFVACLHEMMSSFTSYRRRMGQYDTFRDPEKVLYLQRQLIYSKLQSQIDFVKDRKVIAKLKNFQKLVLQAKSYQEIISLEAKAGIVYRSYYTSLFDSKFDYNSRKNSGRRNKPRYATNVINALLNYGIAVLYSEISKNIHAQGLDPFFGFYHKSHESEQALVYDFAEPYRVLIESAVLEFSNTEPRWNKLHKCYKLNEKHHYQVILDDLTIKRFLDTLSRKFNEKQMFASRFGNRGQSSKKTLTRQITIIKLKVEQLAIFCIS